MDFGRRFLEVFIPLFVAIDPVGLLPLFLMVTAPLTEARRRRVSFVAVATATVLTISFLFIGEALFRFIGILDHDFMIGGGVILLVLAVYDLCIPGKPAVSTDEMVGIVPLAMPMIAGPATLTSVLVLRGKYDAPFTILGLAANFLLVLGVMLLAGPISRLIGTGALRALSKLVMVLLAAIAVSFIRTGVTAAMGK